MITTDLTPSPPIDLPGAVQVEQPRQLPPIRPIDSMKDIREALYFYCFPYNLNSFFSRGKTLRER